MLEFKNSTFNILVLILKSSNLAEIKSTIQEKISQAPDFFKHSPLIIDLESLETEFIDVNILIGLLRQLQFLPIGMQAGTKNQHEMAAKIGIPILSVKLLEDVKTIEIDGSDETVNHEAAVDVASIPTKLVTHPVRSGQRVYSQGDLVILAPVSAGAEVIAEGNIHIYASLRGRALAGVQGRDKSRIFCSNLQAELISIAGSYRVCDDLDDISNKLVQVFLHENALII
ncbi:MAG: septum site-determining protein MinC, partial [Methylococcales bacterium]|nr:septum site-determining protein MinC [Methylococcales bacterium]